MDDHDTLVASNNLLAQWTLKESTLRCQSEQNVSLMKAGGQLRVWLYEVYIAVMTIYEVGPIITKPTKEKRKFWQSGDLFLNIVAF